MVKMMVTTMLFKTLVKMTTLAMISCPAKFHGNLHPKYGSLKDGKYTTVCTITSILGCELEKSVEVTYSINDISWLGEFWFRDCHLATDLACFLDRWYTFETCIVGIENDNFVLSNIHVKSVDKDTDIGLARKRRSLRLGM
jgi:hypothetical protein